LAADVIAKDEQDRFIRAVERLGSLKSGELADLTFTVDPKRLGQPSAHGIFDWRADAPVQAHRAAGQR
jgi:2-methylcitrate dehydratase